MGALLTAKQKALYVVDKASSVPMKAREGFIASADSFGLGTPARGATDFVGWSADKVAKASHAMGGGGMLAALVLTGRWGQNALLKTIGWLREHIFQPIADGIFGAVKWVLRLFGKRGKRWAEKVQDWRARFSHRKEQFYDMVGSFFKKTMHWSKWWIKKIRIGLSYISGVGLIRAFVAPWLAPFFYGGLLIWALVMLFSKEVVRDVANAALSDPVPTPEHVTKTSKKDKTTSTTVTPAVIVESETKTVETETTVSTETETEVVPVLNREEQRAVDKMNEELAKKAAANAPKPGPTPGAPGSGGGQPRSGR